MVPQENFNTSFTQCLPRTGRGRRDPNSFYDAGATLIPKQRWKEGRKGGRKEGRKGGRKGGREEGRKEGWEGRREGGKEGGRKEGRKLQYS